MNRFAMTLVAAGISTALATNSFGVVTSGLIQDLNANAGVTTAGSDVTAWANQAAGGGDHLTTVDGAPQLLLGVANGNNAIAFTNDRLAGTDADAFDGVANGSGNTWFAVVRVGAQNHATKNAIFGTLLNSSPFTGLVGHVAGTSDVTTRYLARPTGSDQFVNGATNLNDGAFHIIAGRLGSGVGAVVGEVFVDSATADGSFNITIAGTTDSGGLAVGAERTAAGTGERFDGDLARLLIYDRPLSDNEIHQVGYVLAQQYGVNASFVPEPASLALVGLGGLLMLRRRGR